MPIFYINTHTHRETEREQERGMKSIIYNLHFPNIVKPQCHPWMPIIWWLIPPSCCPFRYFWEAVSLLECLFFSMMLEFSLPNEDSTLGNIQRHFLALLNDNSSRDGCFVFFFLILSSPRPAALCQRSAPGVKNACQRSARVDPMRVASGLFPCKDGGFSPAHRLLPAGPLWGHLVVG